MSARSQRSREKQVICKIFILYPTLNYCRKKVYLFLFKCDILVVSIYMGSKFMKKEIIMGWIAVILATLLSSFWAFWGIIENFHEGWHYKDIWQNLFVMLIQYLSLMIIFMTLSVLGIRFPKFGGTLYALMGILFSAWIFWKRWDNLSWGVVLSWLPVTVPLVAIGVLFWFGKPQPVKWAYFTVVGIPLLVMMGFGVEPAVRVAGRIDDGDRGTRIVLGNGIELAWAPAGPGWERKSGVTWEEAKRRCRYLTADGKKLADEPQNIWRLPTVDEAARSMMRHGKNCGGYWDEKHKKPIFKTMPDKESPLWDTKSPITYWWTGNDKDEKYAFIIVYHGKVLAKKKEVANMRGFRAVKDVDK